MAEGSGAFAQTTSSMCMKVRAISEAIEWLSDEIYAHAIFVIDSMCTLEKVCLNWDEKNRQVCGMSVLLSGLGTDVPLYPTKYTSTVSSRQLMSSKACLPYHLR